MKEREALYGRLNKYLMAVYVAVNVGLGIYNVIAGYPYYYLLAFGFLLFIPAVSLFYKLFRLKPVEQLNTIIFAFIILSYTIGLVMVGYYKIPYFDKICHGLSGTFTGLLGIIIYYIMKPGRKVERADCVACMVFMLCFALAIAGFWEICEYFISIIFGTDPQWVKGTGVGDTMMDMIVCTIGALLLLPSMYVFYRKGRADILMGAVESFCELNLGGLSDLERR